MFPYRDGTLTERAVRAVAPVRAVYNFYIEPRCSRVHNGVVL